MGLDWHTYRTIVIFLLQYWAIKSADRQTEDQEPSVTSVHLFIERRRKRQHVAILWLHWLCRKYGIEFIGLYIGIVLSYTLGFPLLLQDRRTGKIRGYNVDIRFHRRAIRQEFFGRCDRHGDHDDRPHSLHIAADDGNPLSVRRVWRRL